MKNSTAPVAKIINLNGLAERMELLLLMAMVPLWGIVFPLIGIKTLNQNLYAVVILIGSCFFCFLHFIYLYKHYFSFENNGMRLPGVDHRLRPYEKIKRIYLENLSPLLMAIEYVPSRTIITKAIGEESTLMQLFDLQHLTEESARQLSESFSSCLSNCAVSPDVHDELLNWKPKKKGWCGSVLLM